jgi:hypothetical protein
MMPNLQGSESSQVFRSSGTEEFEIFRASLALILLLRLFEVWILLADFFSFSSKDLSHLDLYQVKNKPFCSTWLHDCPLLIHLLC